MISNNFKIIDPFLLIDAYRQGVFPMSPSAKSNQVEFYRPELRGIFPMEQFHVSKNVLRSIRNTKHTCFINRDFRKVIELCANRESTWISPIIIESYCFLHQKGLAHSVEIYNSNDDLVGGLYGVTLGAAFFGESMFKKEENMDKFALYYCHKQLEKRSYILWDTQFYTEHLGTMGAIEINREEYEQLLHVALSATFQLFAPYSGDQNTNNRYIFGQEMENTSYSIQRQK